MDLEQIFENAKDKALSKAKTKAFDRLIHGNAFDKQITKYDQKLTNFKFTKPEQAKVYRIIAEKLLKHADQLDSKKR